jgi:hypothetical protein
VTRPIEDVARDVAPLLAELIRRAHAQAQAEPKDAA